MPTLQPLAPAGRGPERGPGAHSRRLSRSYSLSCELEPPSESASNTLKARKSTAIVKRWSEWVPGLGGPGEREADSWKGDPSSSLTSPVTGPPCPLMLNGGTWPEQRGCLERSVGGRGGVCPRGGLPR